MKFTQGEWVYDEPLGVIFSDKTNAVIANVPGAGTGSCFCLMPEGQANARLIAAAPEMYRLLALFTGVGTKTEPMSDDQFDDLLLAVDAGRKLLLRIDGKEERS